MKFKTILVPIDFSENSLNAFQAAIDKYSDCDCRLILLHVIEPMPSDTAFGTGLDSDQVNTRQHQLRTLGNSHKEGWLEVETRVEFGRPADVILITATHEKVDLVIIGANAKSKGFGLWLGSNAYAMARALPCSVLIVKPERQPQG